MVNCAQFLEGYSDYRDGLLERGRRAEFSQHLTACPSCARYDRVVGDGVGVIRDLPQIEPSCDFLPRLQHRLYHLDDELGGWGQRSAGVPISLALAVAVAIGMSAWLPLVRTQPATVELPPIAAHAPHRVEAARVLFRSGPLLAPAEPGFRLSGSPTRTLLFQYMPLGSDAAYPVLPVAAH